MAARWWGALVALAVLVWTGIGLYGPGAQWPGLPAGLSPSTPAASFSKPSAVIPLALPAVVPLHGTVEHVMGYTLRVLSPPLASTGLPLAVTPYGVIYVNPSQGAPVTLPNGQPAITSPHPFHLLAARVLQPGSGLLPEAQMFSQPLANRYQGPGGDGWWALSFVRATGPWLVYQETGLPAVGTGESLVAAVSLATGRQLPIATLPSGVAFHVRVGSGRVLIGTPRSTTLYQLPSTTAASLAVIHWPPAWFSAAASSIAQGYNTGSVVVPGLPKAPAAATSLAQYQAGAWSLPFLAPKGWQAATPVTRHGVTTVTVSNPRHRHEWVRLIANPSPGTLDIASLPGAVPSVMASVPQRHGVWLTDVSVGFGLPDRHAGYQLNAVLYPAVTGGTDEVVVSLPAKRHALASRILNSVGLPS